MEIVAKYVDNLFELPIKLDLELASCEVANAYWDPEARELVLCYELLEAFQELADREAIEKYRNLFVPE